MVQRVQGTGCRVQGIHARYGTELLRILIKAGNKESAEQKVFRFCKDIPIYFWDFVARVKSDEEISISIYLQVPKNCKEKPWQILKR